MAGDHQLEAKLTVKVGGGEVHLEGRQEVVREELGRVLDRLFQASPSGVAPAGDAEHDEPVVVSSSAQRPAPAAEAPVRVVEPAVTPLELVTRSRGRQAMSPGAADLLRLVTLNPATVAELYSVDHRGKVRLLEPPRTPHEIIDAILLLLYGMLTLRADSLTTGDELMRGVRSLGFRVGRVPRRFAGHDERIEVSGYHRAKRYSLTAAGIRHCEALISKLLQDARG